MYYDSFVTGLRDGIVEALCNEELKEAVCGIVDKVIEYYIVDSEDGVTRDFPESYPLGYSMHRIVDHLASIAESLKNNSSAIAPEAFDYLELLDYLFDDLESIINELESYRLEYTDLAEYEKVESSRSYDQGVIHGISLALSRLERIRRKDKE